LHYPVLVILGEMPLEKVEDAVYEALSPYWEGWDLDEWKYYLSEERLERLREQLGAELEEFLLSQGWKKDEQGWWVWVTGNPQGHWDWYEIGGRYRNWLSLKEGASGLLLSPRQEVEATKLGFATISLAKDVDWGRTEPTSAVVKEGKWYGGIASWRDATWPQKFRELVSDLRLEQVVVIVDCHI